MTGLHHHVLLACVLLLLASTYASAALVERTFYVKNTTIERLCQRRVITAVNDQYPGPPLYVREGDFVVVHLINQSPYNMTIHWHGVRQLFNGWADGPEYVTQCPIVPGNNYTYRFKIMKQEGTLFWHAHISYLRATVFGAIIIRPRRGQLYPFPKPHKEVPIIFGEWYNANVVDIFDESVANGGAPNLSDAFTINGQPGDLFPCSSNSTYKLKVQQGKTYLLRLVNGALQSILFFKIANHKMTVVSVDASYTNPYVTDVITIAPGQTMDVLLKADQPPASYYMAARIYQGSQLLAFDNTTTTGIIEYDRATNLTPKMPILPNFNDNLTAHKFLSNLTGLTTARFWTPVPENVDERMFITVNVGLVPCDRPGNQSCLGPEGYRTAASLNNESFQTNSRLSMLQAFYYNIDGIYTTDFPDQPPVKFDYTNPRYTRDFGLLMTKKSTKVRKFKYNTTVEIVFQNTAIGSVENHPMHLHGYDFHILAQGFGNYDHTRDQKKFNLVNPHLRNTVAVPIGGWAVIRFRTDNPGVWFLHCHVEVHLPWGLANAFIVENGPTPFTSMLPPPPDLPRC